MRPEVLLVLVASLAFGTSAPLARLAQPADPFLIVFVRLALAGAVLALSDLRGLIPAIRTVRNEDARHVLLAGTALALHFGCFTWGLFHTSLAAAVSLVALEPLAVVVAFWAMHGKKPSREEQRGLILAVGGTLVFAFESNVGEHSLPGDIAVFAAVLLYGVYVSAMGKVYHLGVRHAAVVVYGSAALLMALAVWFVRPWTGPAWPLPATSWAAMVGLGLVPTICGHTLVQLAARRLPPATVGLVSPGETLFALLIGIAVLGLWPQPHELVGCAMILAGIIIALRSHGARPRFVEASPARPADAGRESAGEVLDGTCASSQTRTGGSS